MAEEADRNLACEVREHGRRAPDAQPPLQVPLFKPPDLSRYAALLQEVLASGQIAGGPNVARFESALARYVGNPWTTTCGDVSSALTMCLFHAGVRPGDDVLLSPLVCLATSCPVRNLFANVVWCDIDPMSGNIDSDDIARRITPRTKAVILFHWAGNPADLDPILQIGRHRRIAVIEDAGEALGAEYRGRKIGSTGSDYTVFSFYPNRHLTTIEGGAIACAREADYESLRWLKRYGIHQPTFRDTAGEINPSSDIPVAGWNSYMNHVGATLGLAQMEHLPAMIARGQANGQYYDERLAGVPGVMSLRRPPMSRSAYWVYTFLAEKSDKLLFRLRSCGIQASRVHLRNDLYSCFGAAKTPLPGVDRFARCCVSIPCGWWVSDADRSRIADIICQEAT